MVLAEFTILFRETFEIALLLSLVFAALRTGKRPEMGRAVWKGAAAALLASLLIGLLLAGVAEEIESTLAMAEGILLLLAAVMISGLIVWMARQAGNSKKIGERVHASILQGEGAVMLLSFVIVLREGVEIALFLISLQLANKQLEWLGVLGGIAAALVLAWAVFRALVHLDLCRFFTISGLLLILIAGGLVSGAVHELQESHALADGPALFDLNPPLNADGSYPLLHENGVVGSVLKSMVGYTAAPTALQLGAQLAYLAIMAALWQRESQKQQCRMTPPLNGAARR
jgi:high-affinity iron transporter